MKELSITVEYYSLYSYNIGRKCRKKSTNLQDIANPSVRKQHWHHCHASRSWSSSIYQRLRLKSIQSDFLFLLAKSDLNQFNQIFVSTYKSKRCFKSYVQGTEANATAQSD